MIMKHLHTFEQFVNENLNESVYSVMFDETSGNIQIADNDKTSAQYMFSYDDKKKGWVFSSMGSHGEETRIVAKCPENKWKEAGVAAIEALAGKKWNNFDAMKKDVTAEIKKHC